MPRCFWAGEDPQYVAYHDEEWGVPRAGDRELFEKLCLEGFQAGLSWLTILRKRTRFREVFECFDPERVASFDEGHVVRLLADPGIVRHRGKIEAAIGNARGVLAVQQEMGSFAALLWRFAPPDQPAPTRETLPARTAESLAMSRELRRRGFRFVGPTTCYSLMQATGMVNDHLADCPRRAEVEALRLSHTSAQRSSRTSAQRSCGA